MHDLGGMEGFGPVEAEQDEPVFHFDWERRALGLTFATFALGLSNGGQFRHAIERMDPAHYLTSRYYEHWATGLATRLVETGTVGRDELEARAEGAFPLSRPVVAAVSDVGSDVTVARFGVGDAVRVRVASPRGHTRCPRYVRGWTGAVARVDRAYPVPDIEAHSVDGRTHREPVYCVRFELGGGAGDAVYVDLWESYLEAAS